VAGIGWAVNSIIQLTVISRKLPFRIDDSPWSRADRFILQSNQNKNYLNPNRKKPKIQINPLVQLYAIAILKSPL
jgi:hypothetical protein